MKRGAGGFTLVEILIAMAVFLIGVVAIIGVFPEGLRTTSKSVDDTVAGYVVQSVRDAIVDALRRNVNDESQPSGDTDGAYWVRWWHDGLPATGATFRLARTVPVDPQDTGNPNYWGDDGSTVKYAVPDYFKGADAGADLGGNPGFGSHPSNPNEGMLKVASTTWPNAGTRVSVMRGWWFPDMILPSDQFGQGAGQAQSLCSLSAGQQSGGATPAVVNDYDNRGISVVRLGTLTQTTQDAKASRDVEYPDPLSLYSFQFICGIFNDLTPGGDNVANRASGGPANGWPPMPDRYIPDSPFPGEVALIPNPIFPDNPADILSMQYRYRDRIRKDYRPGLAKITFFPFKNWRPGQTGQNSGTDLASLEARDEVREQNCVRLFQFLASFTQ